MPLLSWLKIGEHNTYSNMEIGVDYGFGQHFDFILINKILNFNLGT